MSNRVHQLIAEIQGKANSLKEKLSEEQSNSASLEKKLSEISGELNAKDEEIKSLKKDVLKLSAQLNDRENISITDQSGKGISDEQIDELVNEIEYCIAQLKK